MACLVRNKERYRRILQRQWEVDWGFDYEAAIFATPKEAPGCSTATIVRSPFVMAGRPIHTLSSNETYVLLIILYNPSVWYVREQGMMYWDDHANLLLGHPESGGLRFPPFRGTYLIARDLGAIDRHPMIRRFSKRLGRHVTVPFPFINDFLVFLKDEAGPYGVNLSVKDALIDFRRPFSTFGARSVEEMVEHANIRYLIEKLYYESAGYRTEQAAGSLIPKHLRWNLRDLFIEDALLPVIPEVLATSAYSIARAQLWLERSPAQIGAVISQELGLNRRTATRLVYRAIWRRELRADLYRPIVPDKPLIPERRDVLVDYQSWFSRKSFSDGSKPKNAISKLVPRRSARPEWEVA